jgi:hypothetical protein
VVWLELAKKAKKCLEFKHIFLCLRFLSKFNQTWRFEEIDKKCLKYVEAQWAVGFDGGSFVSDWLESWWEMRPVGRHLYLGIS